MQMIRVKDWERFQHYKDRSPPWIKLYNDLLDNYDFARLPDASKMHLVGIWLLASRLNNQVPADPEWIARKIGASEPVDLQILVSAGFITLYQNASNPQALARSREGEGEGEVEEEEEEETEAEDVRVREFDQLWQAYPARNGGNPKKLARQAWSARLNEGATPDELLDAVERYAAWCEATGKLGTETVMQARTFLGPNERWKDDYAIPVPEPGSRDDEEARMARMADARRESSEQARQREEQEEATAKEALSRARAWYDALTPDERTTVAEAASERAKTMAQAFGGKVTEPMKRAAFIAECEARMDERRDAA